MPFLIVIFVAALLLIGGAYRLVYMRTNLDKRYSYLLLGLIVLIALYLIVYFLPSF
ncbi:hypothetical protein GCM10027275_52290 [Rhabdobacter roseus]|uniref:Drug/metabolite transporter superfamily protein YnfA n=1 Tax=Rhabdobacter roseus TaxID=1655419 RepID=A0A840U141_9BACT|nr:hypothetical protein [Rhabdobacter roseus]MBB5287303.1 drug/metabolite transporter superfamily protein YnfA [Rhabdobacter roseus]